MDEAELGLEFSVREGLELQNILFYFSSQTVYGICYANYWTKSEWKKCREWDWRTTYVSSFPHVNMLTVRSDVSI